MVLRKIAVVGGGISGLAAALELAKFKQIEVRLFEAGDRLGGVLESIRIEKYLIERSADNFSTLIPNALDLSKEHGLSAELIHPNAQGRRAFVYLNNRIHPIPNGFSLMQPTQLLSILKTPVLSWKGKLRLLKEYWVRPKSRMISTDSSELSRVALTNDESLESFAVRRLGREAFERLVEPIVSGIFTADPSTLSMAATMPQFLEMERTCGGLIRGYLVSRRNDAAAAARRASGARYDSFVAPRNGMSDWIDRLSQKLPADCIRLHTSITALQPKYSVVGSQKWQLEIQTKSKSDSIVSTLETYDGVILATPAAVTGRLMSQVSPQATSVLRGIPYASSAVVAKILNKQDLRARLDGFGLVIPRSEHRDTLAISYTSNKYPGRVPDEEILLRVFLGGALNPQIVDRSDEELFKLAAQEVKAILRWNGRKPNWQAVIRWKESMPQYLLGHLDRIRELEETLSNAPTLRLCGAAYRGVGIPQCVRSGQTAARQLVQSLGLT